MRFKNKTIVTMAKFIKPHISKLGLVTIFMVFTAIIDGVFPYLIKYAIDNFIENNTLEGFKVFSIICGLVVVFQGVNVYSFIYLTGYIKNSVCYEVRKKAFEKLQHLSFSYYDKTPTGEMMSRLTSDVEKMGEAISWSFVDMVWGGTVVIFYIIMMLVINFKLGLITLSIIPLIIYLSYFFQTRILKNSRKARKYNSMITSGVNEGIMGAKATKTLGREEYALEGYKNLTSQMKFANIKVAKISAIYMPTIMSISSVGIALVIWFGGGSVIKETITFGTLFAFMNYIIKLVEPIQQMSQVLAVLQSEYASMERVMALINEEITVKDEGNIKLDDLTGKIEFQNVSFKYETGDRVLKDFSLKVKSGETIAIVGETGSGKSTIVNLACRFYEPTQGEILIDDIDYKELDLINFQSKLGYVLQKPHLFSGTIKENIAYGIKVSDEEIIKSAKLVNAHEFIMNMKDGYDSEVGEGGGLLSTGEKQLISFARAILADPKIFVLDEATSSIDAKTEKLIQDAIDKVIHNRTSFVIAHRLSTIRNADKIIVIQKGEILEIGNHNELLEKKGYYHKLYLKQFNEEKELEVLN